MAREVCMEILMECTTHTRTAITDMVTRHLTMQPEGLLLMLCNRMGSGPCGQARSINFLPLLQAGMLPVPTVVHGQPESGPHQTTTTPAGKAIQRIFLHVVITTVGEAEDIPIRLAQQTGAAGAQILAREHDPLIHSGLDRAEPWVAPVECRVAVAAVRVDETNS